MGWIVTALITGVVAFVATNIDDIFILMLFFSQVNRTFRPYHIVLGQYLGYAVIVALSLLGLLGALVIPAAYLGLLGFAPIMMGLRRIFQRTPAVIEPTKVVRGSLPPAKHGPLSGLLAPQTYGVAAVTFANGGDNISVYIPLFVASDAGQLSVILITFAFLVAVWCYAGHFLSRRPAVARVIDRYGHIIVPFVLIGLGVYILVESGAAAVMWRWLGFPRYSIAISLSSA